MIFLQKS